MSELRFRVASRTPAADAARGVFAARDVLAARTLVAVVVDAGGPRR